MIAQQICQASNSATVPVPTRDYERRISQSGRKIISLDLDQNLLKIIDELRQINGLRRGLQIEDLLKVALEEKGLTTLT